jgi:hypothetical protein
VYKGARGFKGAADVAAKTSMLEAKKRLKNGLLLQVAENSLRRQLLAGSL